MRERGQLGNVFWAVVEHGTFSGATFAAQVLLARTLEPQAYGSFAMSFAVYVGSLQLQTALFGDPVLVLATERFRDREPAYLSRVLRAYWASWLALGLTIALAARLFRGSDSDGDGEAFLAMGLALPFMGFVHLMRRFGYAQSSTKSAAKGALGYALCVVGGMELLRRADWLSSASVYAVLGASSLAVGLVWWRRQRASTGASAAPVTMREAMACHWTYARWGAMTALLAWVPLNSWYVTVPWVAPALGVAAAAQLRALFNLVQPIIQANAAIVAALMPALTRQAASGLSMRWTGIALIGPALYSAALFGLGPVAMRVLYGGAYEVDRTTLALFSLLPVLHAAAALMRGRCLALGRPELPFQSTGFAALASVVVGLPLCRSDGLTGAALGMLAGSCAQLAWLGVRLRALR